MKRGRDTHNNKRPFFDHIEDEDHSLQTPTFPNGFEAESVILTEVLSAQQVDVLKNFIRSVVHEVVEIHVDSYIRSILSRNSQLSNQIGKEAIIAGSETLKFKLIFLNQTASTIFTNNEIESEGGKPLKVGICDTTTNFNGIIGTGPLSSALIQLVVLKQDMKTCCSATDFNKNILSQRVGKRPLIVGNYDLRFYLKNGVAFITGLSFTDNSSWTKSKKFRLGAEVIDEKILAEFPRIGEAVSKPFRVMDYRGEVNKKHHPPRREDEIWRLEKIGKNGVYHNRLSSKGIKSVDDLLKTYNEKGPVYLRKLLGEKVSTKTWKAIIDNALECNVPIAPLALDPSFGVHLVENEAMGAEAFDENSKVIEQKNLGDDKELLENSQDQQFGGKLLLKITQPAHISIMQNLMGNEAIGGKAFDGNSKVEEQKNFNSGHGFSETFFSNHKFGGEFQDLTSFCPTFEHILVGNYEAMKGGDFEGIEEQDNNFMFDDYPPLLSHGEASTQYKHNHEVENASSSNQYYQKPWAELVPKPK